MVRYIPKAKRVYDPKDPTGSATNTSRPKPRPNSIG